MSKPELRLKTRRLRKRGWGIKTIAHKLDISSSTVSYWCRDIKLTLEQVQELTRRSHDPFYGRRKDYLDRIKQERLQKIENLRQLGIKEVGTLSQRDLFIAGIALYWAEGFKKDRRLGFANSDPFMTKFFLHWLINYCKVPKKDIRVRVGLNISHKERIKLVEKHWSKISSIPLQQFQTPFFQKFIWKKEFPKPEEYFGVLQIRANKQLQLFRKINGWIEGLKINKF